MTAAAHLAETRVRRSGTGTGTPPKTTVRLRVLHVVRSLRIGGLEAGVVNLATRLPRSKFEQAILCLEGPGELASRVPRDVPVLSCVPHGRWPWQRHELTAVKLLRDFKPDITHARNYGAWIDGAFAWLCAGRPGKLAFSFHGWDSTRVMSYRRAWCCRVLARMSAVAAVSAGTAREFAAETGIRPERFATLSSGVDTHLFRPGQTASIERTDKRIVIGCVARLVPVKRIDLLIDAFAKVASGGSAELRLIGDGPLRGDLERQACRRGLDRQVRFLGDRDDVAEQLRELDIFVLPSAREGRPTSVMEAMASGLPIIATRVGAVSRLVDDGETGILVPADDAGALAAALAVSISDAPLRKRLGAAARAKAERELSLEVMVRNYSDFYRRLSAHPASPDFLADEM